MPEVEIPKKEHSDSNHVLRSLVTLGRVPLVTVGGGGDAATTLCRAAAELAGQALCTVLHAVCTCVCTCVM